MTVRKKATRGLDVDLNKWCIEMAVRWPVHTEIGYAGQGVYSVHGGGAPPVHRDEDVIGRAQKIFDWVVRND